jgi:hypothetical protein
MRECCICEFLCPPEHKVYIKILNPRDVNIPVTSQTDSATMVNRKTQQFTYKEKKWNILEKCMTEASEWHLRYYDDTSRTSKGSFAGNNNLFNMNLTLTVVLLPGSMRTSSPKTISMHSNTCRNPQLEDKLNSFLHLWDMDRILQLSVNKKVGRQTQCFSIISMSYAMMT